LQLMCWWLWCYCDQADVCNRFSYCWY